ncbi:MAG: hypothetical protein Q9219_001467 [cf. Caloplaca sp. 3 TL-2023]
MATQVAVEGDQQHIEKARGYERLLKARLAGLHARPSIDDIRASITALELQREELVDRLEALRSGRVEQVPSKEQEVVEEAWREWKSKAKSRKRIFMEMWAIIQDELPEGQTKEQLWEELGLDMDGTG